MKDDGDGRRGGPRGARRGDNGRAQGSVEDDHGRWVHGDGAARGGAAGGVQGRLWTGGGARGRGRPWSCGRSTGLGELGAAPSRGGGWSGAVALVPEGGGALGDGSSGHGERRRGRGRREQKARSFSGRRRCWGRRGAGHRWPGKVAAAEGRCGLVASGTRSDEAAGASDGQRRCRERVRARARDAGAPAAAILGDGEEDAGRGESRGRTGAEELGGGEGRTRGRRCEQGGDGVERSGAGWRRRLGAA